jgi:DNA-binding beta-propeller fold protein YncE
VRLLPTICCTVLALLALNGCSRRVDTRGPDFVFGQAGEHDSELHLPREVGFSPDGQRLYVLDRTHRVQVFDMAGTWLATWPTPLGTTGNPRGLDVAPNGDVYVADTHNSQVLVFSPKGKLRRKWGRPGTQPGRFVSVTDVALDSKGSVWACEYGNWNDRVQKFDASGKLVVTSGKFGSAPGEFSRPQGLAVDRNDRLYVADAVNHRIQILNPDGTLHAIWGSVGSKPGQFRYPYDVAFDRAGRLYVAEFGNCRISVLSPEGKFLTHFGRAGHRPGEFDHPWGVNVDHHGRVYVADTMNYRIQRFAPLFGDHMARAESQTKPAPQAYRH